MSERVSLIREVTLLLHFSAKSSEDLPKVSNAFLSPTFACIEKLDTIRLAASKPGGKTEGRSEGEEQ